MSALRENNRRCSYCNFVGHTRRSCLVLKANHEKFETSSRAAIPVRAYDPPPPSAHVVNLRRHDAESDRIAIVPYMEQSVRESARATMDFAAAVHRTVQVPEKLEKPKKPRKAFFSSPPKQFYAFGRAAAAILLLAALPMPAMAYYRHLAEQGSRAVAESTNGFLALQTSTVAAFHSDLPRAETELTRALGAFAAARQILDNEHAWLRKAIEYIPLIGDGVESRERLLAAGEHLALGNAYLLKGVEAVNAAADTPLTDRLRLISPHLAGAKAQYRAAESALDRVRTTAIPVEHQRLFEEFRGAFGTLTDDVEDIVELLGAMDVVFGGDSFRRYLIVFQNHHELRPTGGFLGSYAILDVQKGSVLRFEIPPGGAYDLQGQLSAYVKPPAPLELVNGRWEFQDANWFPNFPASAEKIAWFYKEGRGTTVDGVIAVNGTVLERLLRVAGPVELSDRLVTLANDTAIAAVQESVEAGSDKAAGKPKAILTDIAQALTEKLSAPAPLDALRLLVELHEALDQKEIQVYFSDPRAEDAVRSYGWSGELLATAPRQDYLAVIHANLQGQKSDAKIEQVIDHQAVVALDGSVVDTVTIRRRHRGTLGEAFYGVPNWSYVRAYVPEGAELLAAGGFQFPPEDAFHAPESWYPDDADVERYEHEEAIHEKTGTRITREFGKTAFGNWVLTNPGEISEVFFTYRLPFRVSMAWEDVDGKFSRYELVAQKQSGAEGTLLSRIIYPDGWTPVWRSDERMDLALNGAAIEAPFLEDMAFGLLLKRME